jgi:uncharacterized protein (TIGR03435 family)
MLDWVGEPTQGREPSSGLKLESKKGSFDVFVIDHIDKTPTEN